MDKKQSIRFYLDNDVLISPDLEADKPIPIDSEFLVQNNESVVISENKIPINISDFEKALVLKEKYKKSRIYEKFQEYILQHLPQKVGAHAPTQTIPEPSIASSIEETAAPNQTINPENLASYKEEFMKKNAIRIIYDYREKNTKRTVADFVGYFNSRFKDIEKILKARQELSNLTSISRINAKKEKDNVALIGMVYEKGITKNNNIMLALEDPTGFVKVVITRSREEVFRLAQEIQLDEMIGVTGTYDKLVFANNLLLPDIPVTKELKKSPKEGYFVVISDLQVGNKLFLEEEWSRFLSWIRGEAGSLQQREIASKIKYIFIVGDLVDGVGIYPDQEYNLGIIDVRDQYKACAEFLKLLPGIPIIICPGNHDVGRISDPQPAFNDEYSAPVWQLPNVLAVSSPSLINIYSQPGFEGLDVLLYHGYSFFYYFFNMPAIRQAGGTRRPDLVMKYLLQRRHLAPTHTSTLYVPDSRKDPLTIDKIPDFFFSGHVHRSSVNNYRNITCINASAWVAKSDEEERRGLDPQPGRAFVVNMQTREVKIMNFLAREEKTELKDVEI